MRDGIPASVGANSAYLRPHYETFENRSGVPIKHRPDTVGRGHDCHLKFWTQLEEVGSVVTLT